MKKRFMSTMLMGALAIASTSMVTSCKDYDDDINNLQTQIKDLGTVKTDLQTKIENLTKQLEAANGQIDALKSLTGDHTTQIDNLKARVAAIEAVLKDANGALMKVNDLLSQKADKADLTALANQLATVELNLAGVKTTADAAKQDLEQQKAALDYLKQQLGDNGTSLTKITSLQDQITALQKKVDGLSDADLKKELEALSKQVDALSANVNVLNVMLDKTLRSLVFVPQAYYWGVEATKINYLNNDVVNDKDWISAMAYNVKENKGYDDETRYATEKINKVLSFVATYHMNPSSAKLDTSKVKVSVLDGDYDFTRASEAKFSVKSWSVANGELTVNLDAADASKVKTVAKDNKITTFATKVNLGAGADTTVTSDYAAVVTENIKDVKLALVKTGALLSTAVKSDKFIDNLVETKETQFGHLMGTVHETARLGAQVGVAYNDTLNLRSLVSVHYTKADGTEAIMDENTVAANFDIKFALTYYAVGNNKTDESAHSAIADNGVTFRPQDPATDGTQQQYGAAQTRAKLVGRTPVVRVTLTDKATGKVYDYGYIRILITDKAQAPKADEYVNYTGAGYTYNYECTPAGWSYETKWAVTEEDLYKRVGMTREEFEANYSPEGQTRDLTQYIFDSKTQKFTAATAEQKVGTVSTIIDRASSGDGERSSTLKWEMTGAQALAFFVKDGKPSANAGTGRAIKYVSADKSKGADIYVLFNTRATVIINKPSGVVNFDKNKTVWAKTNAATTGVTDDADAQEAHLNVPTLEDNNTTAEPFTKTLSDLFVDNKILKATITDNTKDKDFALAKLTGDLKFDASNNKKVFNGLSGKKYELVVADDGKTLSAHEVGQTANEKVATLSASTVALNQQTISYEKTAIAKDLLNYKASNELDDNTLKVVIGVTAKNSCHELPLTNNTFVVRFLRPLNVANADLEVQDASTDKEQTIDLWKAVKFTDWRRGEWKDAYKAFYGITGVSVDGVEDLAKISTNPDVLTNQNGNTTPVSLASVTRAIDFTYHATNSTLTYKNNGGTTATFYVLVPVTVHYIWGDVPTTVKITVKGTVNNGKRK